MFWVVCRNIIGLWLRVKNEAENHQILEDKRWGTGREQASERK